MEKCIIAAVADNNAIGRKGDLPWHIPEDLRYFKALTLGCPVIMGSKTFESIGRPLPGRLNIVISRAIINLDTNVMVVDSLEKAFSVASGHSDKCFVIGGGQIYAQALRLVDTLYITKVHTAVKDADTFFPAINPRVWKEVQRSYMKHDKETGYDFEFVTYKR